MKRLLGFAVIVIAALNVLFCILALARNDWYASSSGTSYGLWKICIDGSKCNIILKVPGCFKAVRAFAFLGLFAMIGATVTFLLHTLIMRDKSILVYLTIGLSAIAGFCMMMAFSIFADKDPDTEYGAGFYLCVIAFLLAWTITGLCIKFMIDYNKAKVHHGPVLERLRQYLTEGGSEKANVYECMPMI